MTGEASLQPEPTDAIAMKQAIPDEARATRKSPEKRPVPSVVPRGARQQD